MAESTYHLKSLALAMVVVSSVTLACLAPALLRLGDEFRASLRSWIVGTALVVFTDVVFFVGPELSTDTPLMALAGLGAAEWMHALRLYGGATRRRIWPYVVVILATCASLAAASYPTSMLATSLAFALIYGGVALSALQIREPRRSTGRILLTAIFALIALVMVARLGLFVTGLRSGAPPGFTSPPRALMFVLASIGPVAGSFAFVLACVERLAQRFLELSLTDPLTGIANRRALFDALERALGAGRRHAQPAAVLVVDVDHFKRVNDAAGHQAGDLALVEVARLLGRASRSEDTLGRLGGEEFALVLPGAALEAATQTAERLREVVASTPVAADGRLFELTVSIGVAATRGGDTSASLLGRADTLLYEAKRLGRNRVVAAPPAAGG